MNYLFVNLQYSPPLLQNYSFQKSDVELNSEILFKNQSKDAFNNFGITIKIETTYTSM